MQISYSPNITSIYILHIANSTGPGSTRCVDLCADRIECHHQF